MNEVSYWNFNVEELQNVLDAAKDIIIKQLISERIIEEKIGIKFSSSHTFVVKRPNLISTWINKIYKNKIYSDFKMYLCPINDIRIESNNSEEQKPKLELVKQEENDSSKN